MSKSQIIKLYKAGHSLREIASQLSCSHEFVRKVLKANNIPLRRTGRKLLPDWLREIGSGRREEDLKVTEEHKPYPYYLIYPVDEDEGRYHYYLCDSLKELKTKMEQHPIHLAVKLRDWIGCYRAEKLIEVQYVVDSMISKTPDFPFTVRAGSKRNFYIEQ